MQKLVALCQVLILCHLEVCADDCCDYIEQCKEDEEEKYESET